MTRPCECGLDVRRPKRLFGFLERTTGGAPCSDSGLDHPRGRGLPPVETLPGFRRAGN